MKIENQKELLIELTDKCPFNCIYCSSNSDIKKDHFIDPVNFFKIIRQAKHSKIDIIQLSGGEPFLHPKIEEFIEFILEQGFLLEIYTCGNLKKNGKFIPIPKRILEKYENNNLLTLRFNFQTINRRNFQKLTNTNKGFYNLITSIKYTNKYNIKSEAHIVPNKINLNDLEETIKFLLSKLKIKHIKLLRLIFHGRSKKNKSKLEYNINHLEKILKKIKEEYRSSEVEIGTAFSKLSNFCETCQAAESKFMISYDLKLFPCTSFKNQEICFIELEDLNNLEKIIKNGRLKNKLLNLNKYLNNFNYFQKETYSEICPIQRYLYIKENTRKIINRIIQSKVLH